ncbi:MAG: DUF3540 domain-containing protein [Planctomycetes bacterium]|nr:DUF3540 domain-containing protein [Planctomycetota bacterium]
MRDSPSVLASPLLEAVPLAASAAADEYLGPARVLAVRPGTSRVALGGGDARTVDASHAFGLPFQPQVGDELLVMGRCGQWFAVGVLGGARPVALEFPGDVDVRAVGGTLTLASDRAVAIVAPKITLRAGVLRTVARTVVEKAEQVHRWVRGLLALRAGEVRRTVDGLDATRCAESTTLAKGTVKIDGDQLHLGH